MNFFQSIALKNLGRGFRVHPLAPKEKRPLLNDWPRLAASDPRVIEQWAWQNPDANCGVIADDTFCILESDNFPALVELLSDAIPDTYVTQARTHRPHLYFRQTTATNALGNCDLPGIFEFKQKNRYVVAAGSIHPTGPEYQIIQDEPIPAMPDWLVADLRRLYGERKKKDADAVEAGPVPVGGRHEFLTSVAGKLRNSGLDAEAITAALIPINDARLSFPLPIEDLEHIAQSVSRYEIPAAEPRVVIGKALVSEPEEIDTSMDEEITEEPRPRYAHEVWDGTLYGDFADLCTRDNNIPKKLFIEALRTVVGATVGNRLSCSVDGVNPRAFTILIAPPGMGKGTACQRVMDLFGDKWEGSKRTEPSLLFFSDPIWRSKGIGAQIINPASAPGLMIALEPKKPAKGQTANPLERWQPMPRVVTIQEEIRGLFESTANENSGGALEGTLCELFDRTTYSSTVSGKRQIGGGTVMYSLLGGITKELWEQIFSKTRSTGSGFLSRVNIIATEGKFATVGSLAQPDLSSIANRLFPMIESLQEHPRQIKPTPAAEAAMHKWFSELELAEGISRSRLNIAAWRAALHIAWLKGLDYITDDCIAAGIQLADYQARMREHYYPAEGETRSARCQALIRKAIREVKRCTLRELRTRTNAYRWGVADWTKALQVLEHNQEIRIQPLSKGKLVILLKAND